jgi:aspartate aminotransferase
MVAFRLLLDAGDEAVFSEPAWFCYEPMRLRQMRYRTRLP